MMLLPNRILYYKLSVIQNVFHSISRLEYLLQKSLFTIVCVFLSGFAKFENRGEILYNCNCTVAIPLPYDRETFVALMKY